MVWTDIFIKRPVLSVVVSLLILLIGLRAATVLPIRQYPKLSNTVVNITTVYPGASADTLRYVQMPNINGIYYFDTIDAGGHIDLYRTDTTAAGTQLLETLTTVDPAAATLAPVQVAGKQIVVGLQITGATPADNRALLWTSHGQTGDARPVTLPVTLQSYAALTSINGTPYFYANNTTIYRINADASATAVVIANDSPSKQVLLDRKSVV